MRDFSELGIEPGHSVDEATIRAVEAALGVVLPASYKALVRYRDRAVPDVGVFRYADAETAIGEFLACTPDMMEQHGIVRCTRKLGGFPRGVVPFARDASDRLMCFDYRERAEPSVVVCNPFQGTVDLAAKDFDSFLDMLTEDSQMYPGE